MVQTTFFVFQLETNISKMKKIFLFLPFLILLSACHQKAYLSPAITQLRGNNKTFAILPFEVNNWVEKIPKGATLESLKLEEEEDGYVMQRDLYRYCLREMSRQKNLVAIQHINQTNKILKEKGITYEELKNISKPELADVLQVDAVIYSKVDQIISGKTGFLVRRIMNSLWGTRNQVEATFSIHERKAGKMLWKFEYGLSIAGEDSVDEVSKEVLRNVSRLMIEVNR